MRLAIALVVLLAVPAFSAAQTTWHVPDDFTSIQSAISGTANGDIIIVRPGTYLENLNFEGKAITLKSESGPDVTVIDGQQAEKAGLEALPGISRRFRFNGPGAGNPGQLALVVQGHLPAVLR